MAIYELVKGSAVLLLGFGLLSLLHKDVADVASDVMENLHINTSKHWAQAFIRAAEKINDAKLWAIAAGSAVYALVRFVEGYGLWHSRVWAEWFALLSGAMYLPWEIYELLEKTTWVRILLFAGNLLIVLYMLYLRLIALWHKKHPRPSATLKTT